MICLAPLIRPVFMCHTIRPVVALALLHAGSWSGMSHPFEQKNQIGADEQRSFKQKKHNTK